MAHILSLETSTSVCSVALHEDAALITTTEIHQEQSHASQLAVLIRDVIKSANIRITDLNAVAIASGPGSYTGLRIGTSTAKGICYALDVPLIAIPTLDLLAYPLRDVDTPHALLCPMIDARRMEVYCQVMDTNLKILQPVEAKVIDEKSFHELLDARPVFFFGDGAEKCKPVIKHHHAYFVDEVYPMASALGTMAFNRFNQKQFEDVVYFKPFYLKDFVAKTAQALS